MKKNINLHKKTLDLYVDDNGKQYIGKPKKNIAYILSKNDENKYNVFAVRYLLSVVVGVFVLIQFDWKLGLALGAGIFLVSEICYQTQFLPKLTVITNVEFGRKLDMVDDLKQQPRMKNILVLVAIVVLIILLFVNLVLSIPDAESLKQSGNIIMVIGTALVAGYALWYGCRILKALMK